MPDRFTEGEARRIFAEAARASAARGAGEEGLTLDELQEIGRAAGIDPAAVASAAAAVRRGPDGPVWHGVPLATRRTRVVPGTLDDDAWAEAVAGLRREFKFQGVAEQIGRRRTWTHAVGESTQGVVVQVTVEPDDGGTRLTVESGAGGERGAATALAVILGGLALVAGGLGVLGGNVSAGVGLAAVLAAFAVAVYGLIRWAAVDRSRREPARYDAVLDRLARLARPTDPPDDGPLPARPAPESAPLASEPAWDAPPEAGPSGARPPSSDPRRTRA
ncbi:MAG TPA: hypothetical protein VF576_11495 [Rubricoccaceae bacterium]|jgi:hypothetical protein